MYTSFIYNVYLEYVNRYICIYTIYNIYIYVYTLTLYVYIYVPCVYRCDIIYYNLIINI